ncbi:hypothetical protein B0H11DRAFT_2252802 [Mycena galericulata]|nr:hypothetical protein B0H11DRAFT_2252802 [Mycena galericulata]
MHNAAPISVLSNAPHASLNGDLLALAQARHQSGLPPWTEEEETFERRRLKLQRNYPRPVDPTSEELLEDYEIACVKTGVSRPSAEDYQSVLLVQSEEQALRNWEQQLQHPVQQMILHHPFVNTLPRVGINPDESLCLKLSHRARPLIIFRRASGAFVAQYTLHSLCNDQCAQLSLARLRSRASRAGLECSYTQRGAPLKSHWTA